MMDIIKNLFKKEPEQKGSQFPTHEAGLDATARKMLFEWDKVLRASADKSALRRWLYYREMIDSVERLAYVVSLVERDRLPYLEFIFGKMPAEGTTKPKPGALGVLRSVKDTLEGKASTASADIKKRISDTTKEVEKFGKEQKDLANATRTANELPKWLVPAIVVVVLFLGILGLTVLSNLIK